MKWTPILEMYGRMDRTQWDIGDAFQKCVGNARVETKDFKECSQELEKKGYPSHIEYLRRLYKTACAFPKKDRDYEIAWSIHEEAGTPDNRDKACAALTELGKPISRDNVRWIMEVWREEAAKKRHADNEKAKADRNAAKQRKLAATKRRLAATTSEERKKADQEIAIARQDEKEARGRMHSTSLPPSVNEDVEIPMPPITALDVIAAHDDVEVWCRITTRETEEKIKTAARIKDYIRSDQVDVLRAETDRLIRAIMRLREQYGIKPQFKILDEDRVTKQHASEATLTPT
jgi:hypothetical protein